MGWKSSLNKLNKMASILKDIEAFSSGNSKKIKQRVKNKAKGKLLGKIGFWRW